MVYALYIEELVSRSDTFQGFFATKDLARRHAVARAPSRGHKYRLDTGEPDFEHFYLENGQWNLA